MHSTRRRNLKGTRTQDNACIMLSPMELNSTKRTKQYWPLMALFFQWLSSLYYCTFVTARNRSITCCKFELLIQRKPAKGPPTRMPWKLIKITFPPSQMQTSLNKKKKFKGHPDPRQCLHDGITNGTELVKEDQAILAAHGFVSPIA